MRWRRRLETCLGFYECLSGVSIVSPVHVNNDSPDMVENHEATHKYLAECNSTDTICRFLSTVLVRGREFLDNKQRRAIEAVLHAAHRSTVYAHESVATYLGLMPFSVYANDRVEIFVGKLPRFYRKGLGDMIRAFGQFDIVNRPPYLDSVIPLALASAISAMNLHFRTVPFRFGSLNDVASFIERNSPDNRFRQILASLRPFDQPGVLRQVHLAREGKANSEKQTLFYDIVRTQFPDLQFTTYYEDPQYLRPIYDSLREEIADLGHTFLDDLALIPPNHEDVAASFGGRIRIPGLEPQMPLDASLVRFHYRAANASVLLRSLRNCMDRGWYLCIHALLDGETAMLTCFEMPANLTSSMEASKLEHCFALTDSPEALLSLLNGIPSGSVVVKMDERLADHKTQALLRSGHSIVVVLHDSRVAHVVSVVQELCKEGVVTVCSVGIGNSQYVCLVAKAVNVNAFYVTPMTALAASVVEDTLQRSGRVVFHESAPDVMRALGSAMGFLSGVICTCYGI